jgi:hypothetical protein
LEVQVMDPTPVGDPHREFWFWPFPRHNRLRLPGWSQHWCPLSEGNG